MNTKMTKKEFEEFKVKFGIEVSKRALSCEDLSNDTEAKEFVMRYVEDNIISKKNSNLIQNITYKLANMIVASYAKTEEKTKIEFPIMNKYIGRWLVGSYFFEKEGDAINAVFVEVKPNAVIIQ